MKLFDKEGYPTPPYRGGYHLLNLRGPAIWYQRRAMSKGKAWDDTNITRILTMIVDQFFGDDWFDEEEVFQLLNLDCMVNKEAKYVLEELKSQVTGIVLGHFPKLGQQLPKDRYELQGMTLIIDVPFSYEEQRGYFF